MKKLYTALFPVFFLFQVGIGISQDCQISELSVVASDCDTTGNFTVTINFNVENNVSANFTVVGNGNNYGSFAYESLPIQLGPFSGDNETPYEFVVFDNDSPNCQAAAELGLIDCGPQCEFANPNLEFVSCQSNNTAIVILDFDYFNVTNAAFDLFDGEGNGIGSWLYEDLPITLTNFLVNGNEEIVLQVCDNDNELCCQTFVFDPIDCNPDNCEIFDMIGEAYCDSSSLFVDIDFEFVNTASNSFILAGNGFNYGTFEYSDLPITIGPLNGNSSINWEFVATDSENANCSDFIELGILNCPLSCDIQAFNVEAIECTSDSTYAIVVNAEVANPSEEGFTLFTSGNVIGQFDYSDLPLTITNFPGSGNFFDVLTLCDNSSPDCCATNEFEALLCAGCIIYDLAADIIPCNDDGDFFVVLDFEFQNVGSNGFQVGGNGNMYGPFEYGDLPIELGPFDADGTTFYEFVVFDQDEIGCLAAIEIGQVECEDICNFTDLSVTELTCTGDNEAQFILNFNHTGTGIGFDLFVNNEFFGFYSYDALPLTVEEFVPGGNQNEVIEICDNDNLDCCISLEFESIDCDLPCEISNLVAESLECTSDSTFAIDLDFDFENTNGNSFDIYAGDLFLGFFTKGDSAIQILNVPSNNSGENSITVCANDDSLCCETVVFEGLVCAPPECEIFEAEVFDIECESDSTFSVFLNFGYANTMSNFFNVFNGSTFLGLFEKGNDAIQVTDILVSDTEQTTLMICSLDEPDCCTSITFFSPICDEVDSCAVEIISLFPVECITDSTFRLNVSLQTSNTEQNNFDVYSFGDFVGFFEAENGSFSIQNFPAHNGPLNQIVICVNDNATCCDTLEFEGLVCDSMLCFIDDLIVETTECTTDSTFTAVIDFNYENTGGDTFDIFTALGYFGTYIKNDGPLAIEGFPSSPTGNNVLTICAQNAESCCATIEFEGPVCSPECSIFNVVVEPDECQSPTTFSLDLEFDFVNLNSNGVDLYTGETYLGFFEIGEFPIEVTEFPVPITEFAELTICQSDDSLCCTTVQFVPLNCAEEFCDIFDLVYELSDCDTAGNFNITLNFQFLNPSEQGFNVVGNGVNYGNYGYDDLPLTIGPLPADPELEYEFLVQDLADNTCFDFIDVGLIECETTGINPFALQKIQLTYENGDPYIYIPGEFDALHLFSLDGKLIHQERQLPINNWFKVDCNDLINGIYMLRLDGKEIVLTGKMLWIK